MNNFISITCCSYIPGQQKKLFPEKYFETLTYCLTEVTKIQNENFNDFATLCFYIEYLGLNFCFGLGFQKSTDLQKISD